MKQNRTASSCAITRRGALSMLLAGAIEGHANLSPLARWRSCAALAQGLSRKPLSQLSISSNKRFLQDASGQPFFLVGDCPQNLPIKLAISQLDDYMADCESRGFNLLWICIDGQRSGAPKANDPGPRDRNNNPMMISGWDIGTLNDAYFVTIDSIVKTADAHGIYCMLTPLSECQWSPANIRANSADKWHRYGSYLGKRYQTRANIIWQLGNDNITTFAQHAIVRGIKEAGDTHLMTVNWRPAFHHEGSGWVRKYQHGEDWIDLNAWYINTPISEGGAPCYWQKIEYERENPMPSFQTEAHYQQPYAKATDLDCRMQNYYVALGGGCGGHVYGSGFLADEWDYDTYKNNGGRVQAIHFKKLFTSRDWTTLVPDYSHAFITAGYGTLSPTTTDYVGAAINKGSLGMAYCPRAVTITADMSRFSSEVTARWYDPTDGSYKNVRNPAFPNSGSRQFSTPGRNSVGDGDWVLVLETLPDVRTGR